MQISDVVSLSGRSNGVLQLLPARFPGKGYMNTPKRVSMEYAHPCGQISVFTTHDSVCCAYSAPAVLCSNVVEILYMGDCHRSRVTSSGVLLRSDPQD